MASKLDSSFESDNDSDYAPSEKELNKMCHNEFHQSKDFDHSTNLKQKDTEPLKSCPDDEKTRAEKLWKIFLDDQTSLKTVTKSKCSDIEITTSPIDSSKHSETICTDIGRCQVKEEFVKITSTVDVVEQASPMLKKVEGLEMEKEITYTSLSLKKRKRQPLVFKSIKTKKLKETILQKSLSDWNDFKKVEGIENDLRTYNKGKGGFLNRKAFLERSDLRSFEIERTVRHSKKLD